MDALFTGTDRSGGVGGLCGGGLSGVEGGGGNIPGKNGKIAYVAFRLTNGAAKISFLVRHFRAGV